ncbi:MAG: aspartate--tRNA ligase [candidate division KSB1 bacterium]|nr:aspartate--tRNA ligase [candidate division KSB1 bacterium]
MWSRFQVAIRKTIILGGRKLSNWKRSHTCGELRIENAGQGVTVMGWVDRRRDHGGLIFIDLRDRYGITQIVFDPQRAEQAHLKAKELRVEFVVAIKGVVKQRPPGMINKNLATGEIEVEAHELKILNKSETPPFPIIDRTEASEDLRLKYRYLDLRRPEMQKNLILRHRLYQIVRKYFDSRGFLEIETPMLMRSTPEGARDYLVPSRLYPGRFYALPQSPQTYKQILMVAGLDKYFQIVRCFRDEDLRADRQPEFTQIDMEMSFVNEEDIFEVVEGLMAEIFQQLLGLSLKTPFPRLTYEEAIQRYGTDKPDIRFGLELRDISSLVRKSDFRLFLQIIEKGGIVCSINIKGGASYSRKKTDELSEYALQLGAKGLLIAKVTENSWESSLTKFLSDSLIKEINSFLQAEPGDLLLFLADEKDKAYQIMGNLRLKIARESGWLDKKQFQHLWVVDFPLLEYDQQENRYVARHHPFTSPREEDISLMDSAPDKVRARAYDLVLNGCEIAGGSIRIHDQQLQKKFFSLLKISEKEAQDKFGFLLEAFQYGAPPHGGIAFGFDRLVMILAGQPSIREIIAFPKTTSALSLMDGAPAPVDKRQLEELSLKIVE